MVNKTELMAREWLKKKGYREEDIVFNPNSTPDFTCSDKQEYEVKFLYGNKLLFYTTQIKILKDEDTILVFDKDKFISQFRWKDRESIPFKIKEININNKTIIAIEKETMTKLKELKIAKRESYDEIINRLITFFKGPENDK